MMEMLKIVILSLVSLLVLFVLSKLMGFKQISQMSFFDYVVGITIGSVAAEMSTNLDVGIWKGLIVLAIYAGFEILFSFLSQKSIKARAFLSGTPILLIHQGKIDRRGLKKARIEVDELASAARVEGYFNLADIDYAIMEPTGKISFLPVPLKRPLDPKDFNFAPVREGLTTTVVSDGRILSDNILRSDITEAELMRFLNDRGTPVENILLATVNENGRVDVFEK